MGSDELKRKISDLYRNLSVTLNDYKRKFLYSNMLVGEELEYVRKSLSKSSYVVQIEVLNELMERVIDRIKSSDDVNAIIGSLQSNAVDILDKIKSEKSNADIKNKSVSKNDSNDMVLKFKKNLEIYKNHDRDSLVNLEKQFHGRVSGISYIFTREDAPIPRVLGTFNNNFYGVSKKGMLTKLNNSGIAIKEGESKIKYLSTDLLRYRVASLQMLDEECSSVMHKYSGDNKDHVSKYAFTNLCNKVAKMGKTAYRIFLDTYGKKPIDDIIASNNKQISLNDTHGLKIDYTPRRKKAVKVTQTKNEDLKDNSFKQITLSDLFKEAMDSNGIGPR